ncbi:thiamine diphosphokinase [Aestuariivirga sp.]|uniref:thiamine diphosphokinase n=1 Tax=Aestuariivirga sp. TaxID=2650926 RepID=UPI0039E41583
MSSFAILLGGEVTVTPRLRAQIRGARVIAADSGMMHAAALNLMPELWVGDFDSAGSELAIQYRDIPRQVFPAEKDTTDGGLAIAEALKRGAKSIVLVGGMGGQADHVLGHLGQLLHLAKTGIACFTTSGHEEARPLLPGSIPLDIPTGSRLSIAPFSDLLGLDLDGVKWPLEKRDVPLGSTLTLSNVALGPVRIGLVSGFGIVLAYPLSSDD